MKKAPLSFLCIIFVQNFVGLRAMETSQDQASPEQECVCSLPESARRFPECIVPMTHNEDRVEFDHCNYYIRRLEEKNGDLERENKKLLNLAEKSLKGAEKILKRAERNKRNARFYLILGSITFVTSLPPFIYSMIACR